VYIVSGLCTGAGPFASLSVLAPGEDTGATTHTYGERYLV
jgi:hypothetical protein